MARLIIDYFLLVFVATCGVIQMAAAYSSLKGLLFFNKPLYGYMFGAIATVVSFVWFFSVDNRNIPGLEGTQQFGIFSFSWIAAFLFSIVISSLIKRRASQMNCVEESSRGLVALRDLTYFQILTRALKAKSGRKEK